VTVVTTDAQHFRRVLAAYPSGVTAVAALVDGRPVGISASSFTSVSLDPPLVSVCIAHTSTTWPLLADLPRIGVSVLSAEQEHVARALSSKASDRFEGISWNAGQDGAVRIANASAWLDCSIETVVRAGDHDIVVLRVLELNGDPAVHPLVFHGSTFRKLQG
jgi:flavin reductase (DIM6/NTAB) family NADH-FMN oxidoreductase RutF